MEQISNLLAKYTPQKKTRRTERGDLIGYFLEKINTGRGEKYKKLNYGAIAYFLTKIPTSDLYYIKSTCDAWEKQNRPWGALFWTLLKS